MKRILILITLTLLISCNPNPKNGFVMKGKIKGDIPIYIFLYYENKIDSSLIENGNFYFEGKVDKPVGAYFHIQNNSNMIDDRFYLENKNIQIEISNQKKLMNNLELNFIKIDTISGSATEIMRRDFEIFVNENQNNSNWNSKLFSKLDSIISSNPRNDFSYNEFLSQIKNGNLNSNQINHLFKKLDTLDLSIVQIEDIHQGINPDKILKVGKQLYDFELPSTDSVNIKTTDFRGKILLIDFWASWCKPCRELNPELLEIYKEFKGSNFEILGVSLDTDIEKWNKAILKDELIWKNVIDTLTRNGKVSAKYKINAIPANYLINKTGTIIAKNIEITELRKLLEKERLIK